MKALLATAAAIAAFTVATPAQAQAVSSSDLAYAKAIVQKLVKVGVTIATPSICPDGIVGRYDYSTATLTMCPVAFRDDALAVETISHEAIHAAQHCVGGPLAKTVNNSDMNTYAKGLIAGIGHKSTHVIGVTEGMDTESRIQEYEAYAFEGDPQAVLSILNKVCR